MPNVIQYPYPMVDGHHFSFVSIELVIAGIPTMGAKSINYSDTLEPGIVMGTHPLPIGRTRGIWSGDASLELYRYQWENVKIALGIAGVGFYEASLDIQVQMAEQSNPALGGISPVITDTIPRARIKKVDSSNSQSSDALTVKLDLSLVTPILWNGVPGVFPIGPVGF